MGQHTVDCGHTRYVGRGINIMKWLLDPTSSVCALNTR